MRLLFLVITCSVFIIGCQEQTNRQPFEDGEWIDLTHPFDRQTVYWPTADGFQLDTVSEGMTEGGYYYSAFSFQTAEHGGTHIDAPIHFALGKESVDQISLDKLIGYSVVIDIRDSTSQDIDYLIRVGDLERWEAANGRIPDGSILLLHTGFGRFWPDRLKYMGTDQTGPSAALMLHFPGLSPEAATWLVEERSIKAVGIDTPSIDFGRSRDFMAHRILFEAEIPAFENVANLDKLPATGALVVALPMKITGGSGGPLRIAAFVPASG